MIEKVPTRDGADEPIHTLAPVLAVAVATVVYLAWEVAHRGVYAYSSLYPISDADEWRYTACSRLVLHGYALFSQVFSAQPPLLFISLAGGMHVFGDSSSGARATEIIFGLLALWSTVGMCWLLGARLGAAACGLLLCVSPGFLVYSHTIEAEGPQMAWGALSLLLAVLYRRYGRVVWLVSSGLALAASVLTKLFALETALPLLWILCYGRKIDRATVRNLSIWGASALIPVALAFALFSPSRQWEQVIALHNAAASLTFVGANPPLVIIGQYLRLDLGLSILAAAGLLILALQARWHLLGLSVTWLMVTIAMLLLFKPLFPHHPAILAAPMTLTAGLGIEAGLTTWRRSRAVMLLTLAAGLVYLLAVPRLAHADRHELVSTPDLASSPLAAVLRAHTSTSDLVAVDDLRLAEGANRLVVPPLCDPSDVRRQAGYLTTAQSIAATQRYRPRAVLASLGIYHEIPGYLQWLQSHYRMTVEPGGAQLFEAKPVRR